MDDGSMCSSGTNKTWFIIARHCQRWCLYKKLKRKYSGECNLKKNKDVKPILALVFRMQCSYKKNRKNYMFIKTLLKTKMFESFYDSKLSLLIQIPV